MSGIQMALLGAGSAAAAADVVTIPSGTITISGTVSKTELDNYVLFLFGGGWGGISAGQYGKDVFATRTNLGTWLTPDSSSTSYEYLATVTATNGQGNTVGTFNSWTTVSTFQSVGIEVNPGVSPPYNTAATRTITVQIRKIGTTTVLGTFTLSISATKTDP